MSASKTVGTTKLVDVLIIGGGLSGVTVAHQLQATTSPLSWHLLEARSKLGGRLKNDDKGKNIDLGAAWIWPSHQPFISLLGSTLAIGTFPQPDDRSSTRVKGGTVEFIHKMAEQLPKDQIQLNTPVVSCTLQPDSEAQEDDGGSVSERLVRVETASEEVFLARRVVLAAPPKIISKHIQFIPPLSEEKQRAMAFCETWMAGVTKVGLVYWDRFWDFDSSNMSLSPQFGPGFQVYESSVNRMSALTFFTLAATEDDRLLADQCAKQLGDVWHYMGKPDYATKAKSYVEYHVQRWPKEEYISDNPNPDRIHPHPVPIPALSTSEWGGALLFAGSETDVLTPGIMEGAVSAAFRVVNELK